MQRCHRDEQRQGRPSNRITHIGDQEIGDSDRPREWGSFPNDAADETQFLAHVTAVPTQEHLAQASIGGRHQRVHDRGALVNAVVAFVENVIGQRTILAIGAVTTEETLPDPFVEHLVHDTGAVTGERARAAIDRTVGALHRAHEIERQRKAHLEHARDQSILAVKYADFAGNRADLCVAKGAGHGEQRIGLDHTIGIDGNHDLAAAAPETRFKRRAFAAVAIEAQRRDEIGEIRGYALDVVPGIVTAAVVNDKNLESSACVVRARNRFDRTRNHRTFVVGRDDHRHRWRIYHAGQRRCAVAKPEQSAKQQHQHAHRRPQDRRGDHEAPPLMVARRMQQAMEYVETPARVQEQREAEQNGETVDAVARHFMVVVDAMHGEGRRRRFFQVLHGVMLLFR